MRPQFPSKLAQGHAVFFDSHDRESMLAGGMIVATQDEPFILGAAEETSPDTRVRRLLPEQEMRAEDDECKEQNR